MIQLLDKLDKKEYSSIAKLICHFFYENIYTESTEQQELLYLIYLLFEKEIDALNTISYNSFLTKSFLGNFGIQKINYAISI